MTIRRKEKKPHWTQTPAGKKRWAAIARRGARARKNKKEESESRADMRAVERVSGRIVKVGATRPDGAVELTIETDRTALMAADLVALLKGRVTVMAWEDE